MLNLPQFSTLDIEGFPKQLEKQLKENLQAIADLLETQKKYSWENLIAPLNALEDNLEKLWEPMAHLHAVVNTQALRTCYEQCIPLNSAYETAKGHNIKLYEAIKSIPRATLSSVQNKILDDYLLGFKLSGVALPQHQKKRYEEIMQRMSELSNQFENNILDAVNAYHLHIEDETRLKGLPAHAVSTAQELAQEKGMKGWLLSLEIPCYVAVVSYAEDRALREEFYKAYVTRASDQGPFAGKFDNTDIMNEIMALRQEEANLLGFKNYTALSLATKMAESPEAVMRFLEELVAKSYPQARQEFEELQKFARENYQLDPIMPWDVAYLSEKLQQKRYHLSQEDLRPYFPQPTVIKGLFEIAKRLYGIHFERIAEADVWHPDVEVYAVKDEHHNLRGVIYCDFYARPNKQGGAWMDSLQTRYRKANGDIQIPIATLTCNFAKPTGGKPAILSHDEVLTLFHECGHCLHHVLTQVDYLDASGINGVEWDAVELPSQFFENWCWEKEALDHLSAHVDTQEPLPKELLNKLMAARNFQSAMGMLRQLEFSLFDFRLHAEFEAGNSNYIGQLLDEIRHHTCVVPVVPYNRFQHGFSHIFAGGYAAGYYSYKWAEVLSSDAYSRFEEEGIFNPKTGRDFLHEVLEKGGSRKACETFKAFRGRDAKIDSLLRHNGINVL